MNREILFRIYANTKYYHKCLVGNTNDITDNNWTCPLVWNEKKKEWVHCDNGIIEQYIGLQDQKGRKIFEGDILEYVGGGMFVVCFAEIEAYCPIDERELFTSAFVGVPLEDYSIDGMNCYCPLGPTDSIAKVIGTIHDKEVK